jgi:Fur family ferric uptake transcriptional regulator
MESSTQTAPQASETASTIMEAFTSAGLRSTRQRKLIAQRLAQNAASGRDFATDDLWQELQTLDPQVGRATLFRAVDVLVDLGVLDRIDVGDGVHRYRVCDRGHHHHLICTECRRIEEISVCLPQQEMADAAALAGFDIQHHALELYGRCADCRENDL